MVKIPHGGRARGPKAQPAVQPLVAQLKQAKADMTKEQQEKLEEAYPQLEKYIEELIVGTNNNFDDSSVSFSLLVPVSHSHLGVTVTGESIRSRIRRWATENGLSITFGNRLVLSDLKQYTPVDSSEVSISNIRLNHRQIISLHVERQLDENGIEGRHQSWDIGHWQLIIRDHNANRHRNSPAWSIRFKSNVLSNIPSNQIGWECHKVTISWAEEEE